MLYWSEIMMLVNRQNKGEYSITTLQLNILLVCDITKLFHYGVCKGLIGATLRKITEHDM